MACTSKLVCKNKHSFSPKSISSYKLQLKPTYEYLIKCASNSKDLWRCPQTSIPFSTAYTLQYWMQPFALIVLPNWQLCMSCVSTKSNIIFNKKWSLCVYVTTYLTNTQDNPTPMFRKTKLDLAFLKHVLFPIFQTSTLKNSSNAGIVVSNPGMELNESSCTYQRESPLLHKLGAVNLSFSLQIFLRGKNEWRRRQTN